jgi:transcriptional regulator with XRE-family HTH domain
MSIKSPDPTDAFVGKRVRIARETRSLSQTALGEKLGVTFQQVQKYEFGRNRIGAGRLAQIAAALDYPVSWFFGEMAPGKKVDAATDVVQDMLVAPGGIVVAQAYAIIADASPNVRHAFVQLVKTVAGEIHDLAEARNGAKPARRRAA